MSKCFLLLDLESVQPPPEDLKSWSATTGPVWIFYGPHQTKMLSRYSALGSRSKIVQISWPGKNSLDFHLVFYLGRLTARNPKATFVILSKDTGYDPAIAHALTLEFQVQRAEGLELVTDAPEKLATLTNAPSKALRAVTSAPSPAEEPAASKARTKAGTPSKPIAAKKEASSVISTNAGAGTGGALFRNVFNHLRRHAANRPQSRSALERQVQTVLGPAASPGNANTIVERLFALNAVRQEGNRLVFFERTML